MGIKQVLRKEGVFENGGNAYLTHVEIGDSEYCCNKKIVWDCAKPSAKPEVEYVFESWLFGLKCLYKYLPDKKARKYKEDRYSIKNEQVVMGF